MRLVDIRQKIIYPDIMRMSLKQELLTSYPYFYFDKNGFYAEATNFILTGEDIDIIFLFLVPDIDFIYFQNSIRVRNLMKRVLDKKDYLNNLFVPILSEEEKTILRDCLKDKKEFSEKEINGIDNLARKIFVNKLGLNQKEFFAINSYKKTLLGQKKRAN